MTHDDALCVFLFCLFWQDAITLPVVIQFDDILMLDSVKVGSVELATLNLVTLKQSCFGPKPTEHGCLGQDVSFSTFVLPVHRR